MTASSPSPGAHVALEAKAVANGRSILASVIEHGFTGPLDIPTEIFHPELQPYARVIREAREAGAEEFSDVVMFLAQRMEPGDEQDRMRAGISGLAQTPPCVSALLAEGAARIVREYHQKERSAFIAWEMQERLLRGDDPEEVSRDSQRRLGELESVRADMRPSPLLVSGVNSFPTETPAEMVLLGNGWARRGDIINFVSTAGGGKSVAVTQAAMAWGIGLPYFGIRPPHALRILLFSGEDDGVTIGQCREGFLEHSLAITGKTLTADDLAALDDMLRIDFSREFVGMRFHAHLNDLLAESPADLVIINPLLSYVGGEIVACASDFLRAGLMPVLQANDCGAFIAHHTGKMAKDGWDNTDDTYSAIGGGEMANVPRSILTLRPTNTEGLFVVKVSKRQTTGWKDDNGDFTASHFVRRSGNPERPAWLPVPHDEARDSISEGGGVASGAKSTKKATPAHVVECLAVGPTQRQALIERVRKHCNCSDRPARDAIHDAEEDGLIISYPEANPNGGNPIKWLCLPKHQNHGVA